MWQLATELIVCAIHPIPGDFVFHWTVVFFGDRIKTVTENVSIDVVLALPMSLRFYLVFRCLVLHSRLYSDASCRSIGALNKVCQFRAKYHISGAM